MKTHYTPKEFHNRMARINAKSKRFYLKKAAEYVAHGKFSAARRMFDCARMNER